MTNTLIQVLGISACVGMLVYLQQVCLDVSHGNYGKY